MRRKAVSTPPATGRVTFTPAVTFTGYPDGNKVVFTRGKSSVPVAESYALLMRDKGLIEPNTPVIPAKTEGNLS